MAEGIDSNEKDTPAQSTQERLDALKETVAMNKRNKAARDAGFDDLGDYDQWLLLEELRKLTLANRPVCIAANPISADAYRFTVPNIDRIRTRLDGLNLRSAYYNGIG